MRSRPFLPALLVVSVACGGGESTSGGAATPERGPTDASGVEAPGAMSTSTGPAVRVDDLLLRTRRTRSVAGKPEWMLAADVDGDGRDDVLVATHSPGALLLWRDPHAAPERIPVGDYPLRPVALGGRIAVASRADASLVWLDLSTAGAPREVGRQELGDVPMALTVARLDAAVGDELIVATRHGTLLRVDATGVRSQQSIDFDLPRCAVGLGPELGVVVGFQSSDTLEAFVLEGDALVRRATHALPGTPRDLLAQDLDGDGAPELLVVEGDHSAWILGLGAADPFDAAATATRLDTAAVPMRLRALDAFERYRFAVLVGKSVALELWGETPRGYTREKLVLAGQTPSDFVIADADGVGLPDFWIANRDAHGITLLRSEEAGPIEPLKVRVGNFPNDIATGDLDGDGRPEAFVIDAKDSTVSILVPGEGGRLRRDRTLATGPSPRGVHCADVDGDGALDLLWLERVVAGTRLQVRLGDGAGGLALPAGFKPIPLGVGVRDLTVERFTGLERPLLIAADPDGRRLLWLSFRREGAGLVAGGRGELEVAGPPTSVEPLRHKGVTRGIAVAMQIAVDRSLAKTYTPNIGSNGKIAWQPLGEATLPVFALDLSTGDLDGDGTDDLAVLGAERDGSVRCLVTAVFVRGQKLQAGPQLLTGLRALRVLAADFTGDGVAEIFAANLDSHNVSAWLTRVDGKKSRFLPLDDIGAGVGCIALAAPDLDGDGDNDLLVVDSANDGVSVIVNETPR